MVSSGTAEVSFQAGFSLLGYQFYIYFDIPYSLSTISQFEIVVASDLVWKIKTIYSSFYN